MRFLSSQCLKIASAAGLYCRVPQKLIAGFQGAASRKKTENRCERIGEREKREEKVWKGMGERERGVREVKKRISHSHALEFCHLESSVLNKKILISYINYYTVTHLLKCHRYATSHR